MLETLNVKKKVVKEENELFSISRDYGKILFSSYESYLKETPAVLSNYLYGNGSLPILWYNDHFQLHLLSAPKNPKWSNSTQTVLLNSREGSERGSLKELAHKLS
ncbi:MAG: hypothetical protein DRP87_01630 [Spirochaetes bacterium]|nr:MAG: hypothetical protein DRP87_01630 [Spirochaetota bacterium]